MKDILSAADRKFIKKNLGAKTPEQIASDLDKPLHIILECIDGESIVPRSPKQHSLRTVIEWDFLVDQFTPKELVYFEKKYEEYMGQLDWDVEPTERKQIIQLIETDIMMNRNKVARKRLMDRIETVEKLLKKAAANYDAAEEDKCQKELVSLQGASSGSFRELVEFQKKHDELLESLDSTREQRMKNAMNAGKNNWLEEIDSWIDRRKREEKAKIDAIMREAAKIENNRLSEYHTYADGLIDQPILSADTIKEDHHLKEYE